MTLRLPLSWTKSRFSMYCTFCQSGFLVLTQPWTNLLELGLRLRHFRELEVSSGILVFCRGVARMLRRGMAE
jgi:hypothetical protein